MCISKLSCCVQRFVCGKEGEAEKKDEAVGRTGKMTSNLNKRIMLLSMRWRGWYLTIAVATITMRGEHGQVK